MGLHPRPGIVAPAGRLPVALRIVVRLACKRVCPITDHSLPCPNRGYEFA